MFFEFFRVCENPFGVTPETRFLYPSHAHEEARASLTHSFHSERGFVVLVGQPGMGKTTLVMDFLQKLKNSARIAFLFQTQCNSHDFLEQVMLEFDLGIRDESAAQLHDRLRAFLAKEHSTGKRVVIVVDEAQNLDDEVLETVRLLSDFETQRTKLLHIVLSGQPQLAEKLMSPGLLQLRQRIAMVCRLSALSEQETREYIEYRLMVAGRPIKDRLFSDAAYQMIAELSKGIPRNINNICFHALSIAYPLNQRLIDVDVVDEATRDIDLSKESALRSAPFVVATPTGGDWEMSMPGAAKAPLPQPKAGIPPRTPPAAPVSPENPKGTENNHDRERFRWPENSPAPTHAASHRDMSRVEAERTLQVFAHRPEMRPTAWARGIGAMAAVPVSGYWEMISHRSAVDDRPSISSIRYESTPAVQETLLGAGVESNRRKVDTALVEAPNSAQSVPREQNRSAQFPSRNAVIFILSLVLVMGTLLVLWPAPRPIPVEAWGNSRGDGKAPAGVVERNPKAHWVPSNSKLTSRAKSRRHTDNHGTENPPTISTGDERYDVRAETNQDQISPESGVARTGDAPLVEMTEPLYPRSARAAGLEGTVVLDTTVDTAGKVVAIEPVSGDTELLSAAIDAVKQWRYDPQALALKQGSIHKTVRITFTLR